VLEVVVVGHARDPALADLEEGAGAQHVALALRLGQAGVAGEVLAVHDELGRGARALVIRHDHDVAELLAVAAVHALHEAPERVAPDFAAALVDVVCHVLVQQAEHRVHIAGVEGAVVAADQFGSAHAQRSPRRIRRNTP
jgi:mitochondrial fission protein ELM1